MFLHFIPRNLLSTIIFCLFICISHAAVIDTAKWEQGRSLFKNLCASCHHPTIAQTGPALSDVTARWDSAGDYQGKTGRQWLYSWIRNWKEPVDAKYPYAVRIQNYSPSQMNVFPALSDSEIAAILVYVDNPHIVVENKSEKNGNTFAIVLYVLVGLIIISLGILFMVSRKK